MPSEKTYKVELKVLPIMHACVELQSNVQSNVSIDYWITRYRSVIAEEVFAHDSQFNG